MGQGKSHLTELWRVMEMLIPVHTYLSKFGRLHMLNECLVSYTTIKCFFKRCNAKSYKDNRMKAKGVC